MVRVVVVDADVALPALAGARVTTGAAFAAVDVTAMRPTSIAALMTTATSRCSGPD